MQYIPNCKRFLSSSSSVSLEVPGVESRSPLPLSLSVSNSRREGQESEASPSLTVYHWLTHKGRSQGSNPSLPSPNCNVRGLGSRVGVLSLSHCLSKQSMQYITNCKRFLSFSSSVSLEAPAGTRCRRPTSSAAPSANAVGIAYAFRDAVSTARRRPPPRKPPPLRRRAVAHQRPSSPTRLSPEQPRPSVAHSFVARAAPPARRPSSSTRPSPEQPPPRPSPTRPSPEQLHSPVARAAPLVRRLNSPTRPSP
jgi:hypothetical protein